jgi:hypothetical protein
MEPLYPGVKRWRRSRDGCAAQYQGKGAFFGWQSMMSRHGIECEDRRKISMHGKDIADGDGAAVKGMVKKSFNDNYDGGSQNLVRHLASKFKSPRTERRTRYYGERGWYATTKYIFMFLPEDAMNDVIVAAASGYSGSSKDHYYRSMGATIQAARLLRRMRSCGCWPCLTLEPNCSLTPVNANLTAGTTPRGTSIVIPPLQQTQEARHTRNARNPLPEFCESLKIGTNVVVRVSAEERSENPDEEYFVAKIEEKAKKLEEDGVYSAVPFKKNDWIVSVCWYCYISSNLNGGEDRLYAKGFSQWIPCGSIIRSLTKPIKLKWCRRSQYYRLSKALNEHIEQQGDLY